ncbi:hypothetical protein C8Q74DRAFT_1373995 [Fomes fomentarius]|nr:hypothetical protein C8Q74DRAFT_1373995 [Fomes fomentarius]
MPQLPEAQAFLSRITQLPPGPGVTDVLTQALQPSLDDEAQLRKLWATDKDNARLRDPYVGLVDVFDAPDDIRKTRARVVSHETDLSAHYVHPLDDSRRRKEGEPSMVADLDEFKRNWALFTEGSLSQLTDWSNVIASGGSVLACLTPVPESAKTSKRAMRKYYHNNAFPTSDVDLFLYGLTPEQAEAKMQVIYEAVRDSVPWDVTCVRTKHTVSIHSQYPYRSVQIVLRLYNSPAEILAGFDVDAPCCAFDGQRVWASPRAIVAMMRQCNTVDVTRRSPSYEVRLTKYSMRDFEVYVPTLRRADIDPTIFERSLQRVQGLARLVALERFSDPASKDRYLVDRRKLRARPEAQFDNPHRRKKQKGDLKANLDIGGLEMNDYDVVSLHIPYGPGWDARRIDKLVYQTDLGMNSPFNPKNKGRRLHRHPAFFGTLQECLDDCCEYCPEPKDDEEKKLQGEEDESYIRGRVQFMQDDPGRQSISGSFHPIDEGEWTEQAYIGPTEKLFNAIVLGDRATVHKIISEEGFDIDRRDHVGRTPLQVAILSKEIEIVSDLIDAGARMTSRLVDGRTALHLAAQLNLPTVIRKLLERSAVNAEKANEEEAARSAEEENDEEKMDVDDEGDGEGEEDEDEGQAEEKDEERDSSEDDWSSDTDDAIPKPGEKNLDVSQIPEDEVDVPDVFEVNATDWDYSLTPLQYAVIFGSLDALDELLAGGADATLVTTKGNSWSSTPFHALTLTALTRDSNVATDVVKRLISGGASSSQADDNLFTIFHRLVCVGKPEIIEAVLRHDPNAKAVLDSPHVSSNLQMTFPVVTAIFNHNLRALAILLAYGAKINFTEEDHTRASDLRKGRPNVQAYGDPKWQTHIHWPVETALALFSDLTGLLVKIGADYDMGLNVSYQDRQDSASKKSLLDAVRGMTIRHKAVQEEEKKTTELSDRKEKLEELAALGGWKGALGRDLVKIIEDNTDASADDIDHEKQKKYTLEYLVQVEQLLLSHHAKSWKDLYPNDDDCDTDHSKFFTWTVYRSPLKPTLGFFQMYGESHFDTAPSHLVALYEELFTACAEGDNAKIEELCLPKEEKSTKQLLHITMRYGDSDWCVTPFSLALQYRHWATARVVLAISVAQYKPKDTKPPKFRLKKVALEEDDAENESDEDSDMDDGDDVPEVNFIDIAQRSSTVTSDAAPSRLLEQTHRFQDPQSKAQADGCVLFKAVLDNDFEAFVQIADLYKFLPKPIDLPTDTLVWILQHDRSTMLDELIRRTGRGIELPQEDQSEEEATDEAKSKKLPSKTYFGLNVHGKKRKDLVAKSDPNAPCSSQDNWELPLLWQVAYIGAIECVRYLATERPVSAYQYYASTHTDDRARYLKRINDQIPQRLGWTMDELNESVITAAVIGNELEVLKTVIDLQPVQLQSSLMARIKYAGLNHILVAANSGCSTELFDYLLSKGVSPTGTDTRGWNILHYLCAVSGEDHIKLLKHVLNKIPEDLIQLMLLQQSNRALNTPLHLAVKRSSIAALRLLLPFKADVFLLRDRDGSIPLHLAVTRSVPEIARMVGEAGPEEAYTLEDGVGNTPLEIAVSNWLQYATTDGWNGEVGWVPTIDQSFNFFLPESCNNVHRASMDEVESLRKTLEGLISQGRLRTGTKLATELVAFADRLENEAKKKADSDDKNGTVKEDEDGSLELWDTADGGKTLDYITGVITQKSGLRRQLVHLSDVHVSVKSSLERSGGRPQGNYQHRNEGDEDGLDPEVVEDKGEKSKDRSAIATWHPNHIFNIFGDDPF